MASPFASGATFTFSTAPDESVTDGFVSASATFTTGAGFLTVTLTDLLVNPISVGQLVSDVDFSLSSELSGTTVFTMSADQIFVNSGGTTTPGVLTTTGWQFLTLGTGFTICVVCPSGSPSTADPSNLIIGPAGPGGVYTAANSSIAGNVSHNPFLDQEATFTITNSSITADTVVSAVIFSFGTTFGSTVPGDGGGGVSGIPEPTSALLLGSGVLGMLVFLKRFVKSA